MDVRIGVQVKWTWHVKTSVRLWQFYVVSGRQYRIAYWHASGITGRASAFDVAAIAALVYRLSANSSVSCSASA